jgi:large subunit ribosomal protein L9
MEVILKEAVKNLGKAGDVVRVSEGYARNFLFPSKKAVPVTGGAVKAVQEQARRREEKVKAEFDHAKEEAKQLSGAVIRIKKKASPDGKLFGSVAEADIAAELEKLGHKVDKSHVKMDKHIKEPGTYDVTVHFKGEAGAVIKVTVEKDDGK